MKYLLDTHVFIWLDNEPQKLSAKAAALCADSGNQLLLSIVSVWEMQIKIQLGKLKLPDSLATMVSAQQSENAIQILSIDLAHVLELGSLPDHHRDPLIAS